MAFSGFNADCLQYINLHAWGHSYNFLDNYIGVKAPLLFSMNTLLRKASIPFLEIVFTKIFLDPSQCGHLDKHGSILSYAFLMKGFDECNSRHTCQHPYSRNIT